MLGQPASWQTVCRPWRFTRLFSAVYSGPVRSLVLIQGGLRSIGVWLLRASMRSIRRPSGASTTPPGYVGADGRFARRRLPARGEHIMLLSTMNYLPGYEVTAWLGEVFGITVRS